MNTTSKTIEDYYETQPDSTKVLLEEVRKTIRSIIPEVEETISYRIPTFKYYGNLVHFGGYKNHIGFYPGAAAIETFKHEIEDYTVSKGTIQFQLNEPIPYDLIAKITQYQIQKNTEKALSKPIKIK
jgi:uncharacterized protein YdhG (YjbR/CyaY superfamily)